MTWTSLSFKLYNIFNLKKKNGYAKGLVSIVIVGERLIFNTSKVP